jgi:LPXTG-motif cell wall-anchored protein
MFAFLDWLPAWMTSWYFMIGMFVALLGLIGVLMYLRNKRDDE